MMNESDNSASAMQRIRVGMTGLAFVLVMIGLASAILTSANREDPVEAVGAPKPDVVANMTDDPLMNSSAETKVKYEPLAELGVAPGTAPSGTPSASASKAVPAPTASPPAPKATAAPR